MSAADYLAGNRQACEFALSFLRHITRRVAMSNIESVIESVDVIIDAYVASWNETDPAKRQSSLAASCAATASYRDPVMVSDGHAGMDAMLAGVQAKFPGFVLRRISKVDSHNNAVRFAWSLGPVSGPSVVEGVDFATLSADGKLANIVGFIDKM
jgi:SnoaL-like domain